MAAITLFNSAGHASMYRVRTKTAEIGNSAVAPSVDWISTPSWARYAIIYLNVTALAGTTRTIDFKILGTDPVAKDDTTTWDFLDWNGITQMTATGTVSIFIGPGITGIADDDTATTYKLNGVLPPLMGLRLATDRTDGDETYTYTLSVVFKR